MPPERKLADRVSLEAEPRGNPSQSPAENIADPRFDIMATALDHLNLGGKIAWLSQLDTAFQPERNLRRTSIVCTIGPKTNSVESINKLREAGLNVVRMNFSHGSYEYHRTFPGVPTPSREYLRVGGCSDSAR